MLNHFRVLPFLAGIAIAFLVFMVYTPQKQVIRQYPHPTEAEKQIFKDPNGTCYKYSAHVVDCDANEGTLTDYPIQ